MTDLLEISAKEAVFSTELQDLFFQHRRLLLAIDKEIINNRTLSTEKFSALSSIGSRIVYLSHRLLRLDSALSASEKVEIGYQLQAEMLPPILLTNTIDRFFLKTARLRR